MNRVVAIGRRKVEPRPAPPSYVAVPTSARAAADCIWSRAAALRAVFSGNFTTGAGLAKFDGLATEIENALAELREVLS